MLRSKKKIIIAVVILCAVVIIGVGIYRTVKGLSEAESMQIEDTNGAEDKTLCHITDRMIEGCWEDYYSIRSQNSRQGKNASGVDNQYEEKDNYYSKTTFQKLSGVYICNSYKGDGNEAVFEVHSKVTQGNLRIVVTDEENVIIGEIPIDCEYRYLLPTKEGKIYYVKLVGESAELSVELWRNKE